MLIKYMLNQANFKEASKKLPAYFERLLNCRPVRYGFWGDAAQPKYAGVYYFKKRKALYVGESTNIFERYNQHTSVEGNSNFALKKVRERLARHEKNDDYLLYWEKSNEEVKQHPNYNICLANVVSNIKDMWFRYVRVHPSFERKLLEVYCMAVLGTANLKNYKNDEVINSRPYYHSYVYYNSFD